MVTAAALIAVAAVATACDAGATEPRHEFLSADTTITYRFTDSSVPPEYHRSFVLTIAGGVGTVVVDSYGQETARDEQEVSDAVVQDFLTEYHEGGLDEIFEADIPEDDGCAGGTTVALTLEDAEVTEAISIYRCGTDEGERAAIAMMEATLPLLGPFDMPGLTEDRYSV